jgi:hypothetical protein
MSKKEIKINPVYFQYGNEEKKNKNKNSKKKKTIKKEELLNVGGASVREILLNRLKEYRKKNSTKKRQQERGLNIKTNKNISSSFINQLKNNKNKTENSININPKSFDTPNNFPQATPQSTSIILQHNNNNNNNNNTQIGGNKEKINILPEPEYSNLKNSTKPTFRELYKKVQQEINERNEKKTNDNEHTEIKNEEKKDIPKVKEEIAEIGVKKIYVVGKNKTQKKIGVFIPNNNIRRKNQEEHIRLKKTNYKTVKNYLKKNNLIKYGTRAPTELLREIYESSKKIGGVQNNNGVNLIHNYVNNENNE